MDEAELVVDGNAMGGVLREVFIHDMTAALVACGGCGAIEPLGAEPAYTHAPGLVLRCRQCNGVLLVVTRRGDNRHLLGFDKLQWLEISGPDG
jgi:hypothetical protein